MRLNQSERVRHRLFISEIQMADSDEFVDIARPTLSKSDAWTHFGHPVYLKNGVRCTDKTRTVCKLCQAVIKHAGNTTNMRTHIARHHPSVGVQKPIIKSESLQNEGSKSQILQIKSEVACGSTMQADVQKPSAETLQPNISTMFRKQSKYPASCPKAQLITKQVATYIVSDMRPLSVVDNKQFKKMLELLDPKYSLPSRKHFAEKVIPALYDETRAAIESGLREAKSISITTDSWTSRATQSYMTVTAHYVSKDWEICNNVLTTRMLSEAHTGENLGNALKNVVNEWGLERLTKIPVVSDNAANMDIAARTAGLEPSIKCFAHTINLASQRGLKVTSMARLLGRIRRIVSFFHKSTTATSVLSAKQSLMGVAKHKLINDVATRWNSSYEMIDRFLEQQPAILSAMTSSEVRRNATDIVTLSDSDINESERAVEVLKPLKVATAIMCDEHYPTVSLIYPLKAQIEESMTEKPGDSNLMKEVKKAVKEDLSKRYTSDTIEDFLLVASALDPRFRSLPHLDNDRRNQVFDNIHMKAVSFSQNVNVKSEATENEPQVEVGPMVLPPLPNLPDTLVEGLEGPTPPKQPTMENPAPPKQPTLENPVPPEPVMKNPALPNPDKQSTSTAMEDFFRDVYIVSESPGVATAERVSNEIREYRLLPNIPVTENPLQWWKHNSNKFPFLSEVAKYVLSIPGTSVPSERVFSTAGDIVTATRSCLDPDLVDKLIFLKKNLRL